MSMIDYRDPEVRRKMHEALVNFPANGKPPRGFSTEEGVLTDMMILIGFLETADQTAPCRECGTQRITYSYVKITLAGRLFMEAMESQARPRPCGDSWHTTPVGEGPDRCASCGMKA